VRRCLLVAAIVMPLEAGACVVDGESWSVLTMPGRGAARFDCVGDTVEIEASGAVGFLYRPSRPAESGAARLTWRWRVDAAPPPTNLSESSADDRPAAVHLVFPNDGEGLLRRLGAALRGAVAGAPFAGRMLTYVWGGLDPPRTVIANPYMPGDGYIVVLRNGAAPSAWVDERIDFRADFRRAFGRDAPDPIYIAVSADTDDRGGSSRAAVARLRFEDAPR
jgi:hypothetical protein